MNRTACSATEPLLAAARRGPLDDGQQRHAAACAVCARALRLESSLRGLAGTLGAGRRLPSVATIERRAELRRRELAAEHAERWLGRWQRLGLVIAAAIAASTLVGAGRGWLDWLVRPLFEQPPAGGSIEAVTAAGAVLAASALAFWLMQEWAGD